MASNRRAPVVLHASAVAFGSTGLLITGNSGSGKSSLVLQLMALGAKLIADDRVQVIPLAEGGLRLSAPAPISGLIEARGFGLIAAEPVAALARAMIDLDTVETARLPERKEIEIAGETLRLFSMVESPVFPAMLKAEFMGSWESDE